ncbi:T9SS type A sorting domain-containing protein [Dyadobacter sp. CY323]|uniref:T9SS type A sorting domain-containing protein n=1 Tax=Dyadobacter sp. CY323 TaxID=2907302 RepID=UPI001F3209CD|nr:T9SS type A sorting domain-containing protein [Dyadobacter sp. CY323]MCE6987712.1 T9SS type A sorting domain-containing protein [Dyadobacter sp. CY323]
MKSVYRIFLLIASFAPLCHATHFKGGEIMASHVSGQNYKVTVRIYMDLQNGEGAANSQNSVLVCFGDGATGELPRTTSTNIGGNILVADFVGTHTYSSSGNFQISTSIDNRGTGILNLQNPTLSPAFLWTVIDTQRANSTPVMPNLLLVAGVRQVFSLDLKPTVADQDSISIRVHRLSKASPGTCGVRMIEHGFMFPNEVSSTGTFRIEQNKLVWKAPELLGNYSFAMVVDEWRDGVKISETYREGIISVIDKPGETVEIPPYISAEYGNAITSAPHVKSAEVSIAVEAYPVPTQDFVTVKAYSKTRSIIRLQLIDLSGRVIREIATKNPEILMQEEFDMRNLASGVYLIRADNARESATQKLIR